MDNLEKLKQNSQLIVEHDGSQILGDITYGVFQNLSNVYGIRDGLFCQYDRGQFVASYEKLYLLFNVMLDDSGKPTDALFNRISSSEEKIQKEASKLNKLQFSENDYSTVITITPSEESCHFLNKVLHFSCAFELMSKNGMLENPIKRLTE